MKCKEKTFLEVFLVFLLNIVFYQNNFFNTLIFYKNSYNSNNTL